MRIVVAMCTVLTQGLMEMYLLRASKSLHPLMQENQEPPRTRRTSGEGGRANLACQMCYDDVELPWPDTKVAGIGG